MLVSQVTEYSRASTEYSRASEVTEYSRASESGSNILVLVSPNILVLVSQVTEYSRASESGYRIFSC